MLILFARDIWANSICTRWFTGSDWLSHGQEGSAAVVAAPVWPTPEAPAAAAAEAVIGSVSTSANAADAAIRRMWRRLAPGIGFITASDSSYQRDHACARWPATVLTRWRNVPQPLLLRCGAAASPPVP